MLLWLAPVAVVCELEPPRGELVVECSVGADVERLGESALAFCAGEAAASALGAGRSASGGGCGARLGSDDIKHQSKGT